MLGVGLVRKKINGPNFQGVTETCEQSAAEHLQL